MFLRQAPRAEEVIGTVQEILIHKESCIADWLRIIRMILCTTTVCLTQLILSEVLALIRMLIRSLMN